MAQQADGTVYINSSIDTDGFTAGGKEIEAAARRAAKTVKGIGDAARIALERQTAAFVKSNQLYAQQEQKVKDLEKTLEDMSGQQVETEVFKNISKELDSAEKKLDKFYGDLRKIEFSKGLISSTTIKNTEKDIDALREKIEQLFVQRNAASGGKLSNINSEIDKYQKQLENLNNKLMDMKSKNEQIKNSYPYKNATEQIDIYSQKVDELRAKMEELKASGGDYQPVDTSAVTQKLISESQKLQQMENSLNISYDALKSKIDQYGISVTEVSKKQLFFRNALSSIKESLSSIAGVAKNAAKKIGSGLVSGLKKAGAAMLSFHKSTQKSNSSLGSGIKNILKYSLGIGSLLTLFRKIRSAVKDGFSNLYEENDKFKNSLDSLKASLLTLKNALATAFAPIVQVAIPYIQQLVEWVTKAADAMGQLMAALLGQKTYTKAIKQTTAALKEETKASNKQLSSLDKLNNLTSESADNADAGTGGMFEEVPISDKWKNIADWLKDMWENSDFYELGKMLGEKLKSILDNIPWDEIKEKARKLGKSLASLINGFIEVEGLGYSIGRTLAEALNTAFEFLNAFVHELHWESVGKFIAETINGFFENIDWPLIYDTFITGAKGLGDAINSFVDNLNWDAIATTISNAVNTFTNTVYTFFTTVDWRSLGQKVGQTISDALAGIDWKRLGEAAAAPVQAFIDFMYGAIKDADWGSIGTYIADALNSVVSSIDLGKVGQILGKAFTGLFQMAIDFAKTFDWIALGDNISSGINGFFAEFDGAKFGQAATSLLSGLLDTIIETIEIIDWAEVWKDIIDFLVNVNWLELIGKLVIAAFELIAGLVKGLIQAIKETDWKQVWNDIVQAFKDFFGIHSPSTVMEEQGGFLAQGLINGIKAWIADIGAVFGEIKETILSKWEEIKADASETWENIKTTVSEKWESIKTNTSENWENIKSDLSEKWSDLKTSASEKFEDIKKKISESWNDTKSDSSQKWNDIKSSVQSKWDSMVSTAKSTGNDIKNKFLDAFESLKTKAKSIFESIKETLQDVWSSAKSKASSIGSTLRRSYSSYSVNVPSMEIPVTTVPTIATANIPYLATGAVIPPNAPFAAILGDQKNGKNLELPENLLRKIVREKSSNNDNGDINLNLTVECEGYQLLSIMQKLDRQFYKQNGRHAFT